MLQPTPDQLEGLSFTERSLYRLSDVFVRRLPWFQVLWHATFMTSIAKVTIARRMRLHGMEHLEHFGKDSSVVLVANHRSFFDFYAISAATTWYTDMPRRILFPVRANFFYDRWLGALVNFFMSAFAMFPPIFRKHTHMKFNRFALARVNAELEHRGTLVGLHPEGTRNKGPDPYQLLKGQPGVGKVILEAPPHLPVIPVFVLGLTNAVHKEAVMNFTRPKETPVHVLFGPPVDLSDLRAEGSRPATQKRASDRCLEAIAALARQERTLRETEGHLAQVLASEQVVEADAEPEPAPEVEPTGS